MSDKLANTRRILRTASTKTLQKCEAGYERLAIKYPGPPVERLLAVVREELARR